LSTQFGTVQVERIAYRAKGASNLYPADAELDLPIGRHSHTPKKLAAIEAARGSFADAQAAIERATGTWTGRRQAIELVQRTAADIDALYTFARSASGSGYRTYGSMTVAASSRSLDSTNTSGEASSHIFWNTPTLPIFRVQLFGRPMWSRRITMTDAFPRLRRTAHRRVALSLAAVVSLTGSLLAGCSASSSSDSASAGGTITLRVGDFGTFGYNDKGAGLFAEYMKLHPNIKIVEDSTANEQDYWNSTQAHLAAGSGADDIQAFDVSRMGQVTTTLADKFVDLSKVPGVVPSNWAPVKWAQGKAGTGKVIGLGTDLGPEAVCYNTKLFKAAGLPTDSQAVGALWSGSWDAFVNTVGKRYQAHAPKGTYFLDSGEGLFNSVVGSGVQQYYDASGKPIYDTNPSVKNAWTLAGQAVAAGETSGIAQFSTQWAAGFAQNTFATTICPAWQMANIVNNAGQKNSGVWNIAPAPQASNWGGSYLSVPAQGRHTAEAEQLAQWLTTAAQEAKVFATPTVGNFPSNVKAYSDPSVANAKNTFLSNAPIGQIFSAAAKQIPAAPIGQYDGVIRNDMGNGVLLMEQKHTSPDQAWQATMTQIKTDTTG
jgi:cellobiose transport system substrate-binding protein